MGFVLVSVEPDASDCFIWVAFLAPGLCVHYE